MTDPAVAHISITVDFGDGTPPVDVHVQLTGTVPEIRAAVAEQLDTYAEHLAPA